MTETILDILSDILPLAIFFLFVYFFLQRFFKREEKARLFEVQKKWHKETIPIRLQAYERLTLLLTRLAPEKLIRRTQKPGMTAKQLAQELVKNVEAEFEHNITQQIYVSGPAWEAVELYKSNMLQIIQQATKDKAENAPSFELAESILTYYIDHAKTVSAQKAIHVIKNELNKTFT